ncbi:MAG: DinB family protein [Acidobacteriia bacterium]|nr:DinB family protein [Terriglobia bacterium]
MKLARINVLVLLLFSVFAAAQDKPKTEAPKEPPSVTTILDRSFSNLEREFVPAVEAMPDGRFTFAPTNGEFKGVRTFRDQAMHVAATNYLVSAAILGEKPPVDLGKGENGPDNITSKPDVVKFVKESCAYTHKALATVNDKNINGWIKNPFGDGQATRLGMAMVVTWHSFDHYGQMVEYLRMNGIIPPASRPQK